MAYIMKNEGFPYKLIYRKRAKVGRVCRHADGRYMGIIGSLTRYATTEHRAFAEIVAADRGFDTVDEMNASNRAVRAANRQSRNTMRAIVDRVVCGDYDALDQLLGIKDTR